MTFEYPAEGETRCLLLAASGSRGGRIELPSSWSFELPDSTHFCQLAFYIGDIRGAIPARSRV